MTIYFASLRLCVKFGSQSREDAKIIKDHICEKHSTTNLFCGMVLVTDSHNKLYKIVHFVSSSAVENPCYISTALDMTKNTIELHLITIFDYITKLKKRK